MLPLGITPPQPDSRNLIESISMIREKRPEGRLAPGVQFCRSDPRSTGTGDPPKTSNKLSGKNPNRPARSKSIYPTCRRHRDDGRSGRWFPSGSEGVVVGGVDAGGRFSH